MLVLLDFDSPNNSIQIQNFFKKINWIHSSNKKKSVDLPFQSALVALPHKDFSDTKGVEPCFSDP